MAIHWKKQEFGLVARIPPVTAAIYRSSRTRACTRRFDWAVFSQGKRLAALEEALHE